MHNAYSITKGQAAIIALTRAMRDTTAQTIRSLMYRSVHAGPRKVEGGRMGSDPIANALAPARGSSSSGAAGARRTLG